MRYSSIYLVVKDFDKSVHFYEELLKMKVSDTNGKRFALFQNDGLNLCLMNGYYDLENPDKVTTKGEYWEVYDNLKRIVESENKQKIFLNFGVDDLKEEYNRIKGLGIAKSLTPIRYINVFSPYWYFNFMDPDGNPIEVTGAYTEEN